MVRTVTRGLIHGQVRIIEDDRNTFINYYCSFIIYDIFEGIVMELFLRVSIVFALYVALVFICALVVCFSVELYERLKNDRRAKRINRR